MSFVTTAPAHMTAPLPIVTPCKIVAPIPIHAYSLICIGLNMPQKEDEFISWEPVIRETLCEMETLSSIVMRPLPSMIQKLFMWQKLPMVIKLKFMK